MAISKEDLEKDVETLYAMGAIFCAGNHPDSTKNERGVCPDCDNIISYSIYRTEQCPHDHKGNCKQCSIHCYKPEMRAGIKEIMSYGAPRMIYKHPVMTTRYVKKKLRDRRELKTNQKSS